MTDFSPPADPAAPTRKRSHELVLWGGFGLCLVIALLTVVLPELSGGDNASKRASPPAQPPAAPAR